MRFRRLTAPRFGALSGQELDLPDRVVLLFGHNEAGKSTFQTALETAMFGFEPAKRDAHPLWTWAGSKGDDLRLEADVVFDDGSRGRIERTLQATGKSRRAGDEADFAGPQGSNTALEELYPASRTLYRRIYSLGLGELRELSADVQDRIDHLLVADGVGPDGAAAGVGASNGARRTRPIFEVVKLLETEQGGLWRPDQRGKPRAAALSRSIRDEARRVHLAREEEHALRDAYQERERNGRELDELHAKEAELAALVRDAPLCRELAELERRKRALPAPIDLAPLEGMKLVDPGDLHEEIERLERALDGPRARLALAPVTLEPRQEGVIARQEDVVAALQEARSMAQLAETRSRLRERVERLRRGVRTGLAALTGKAVEDEELARLPAVPLEALRAACEVWQAAVDGRGRRPGAVMGRFALAVIGLGLVVAAVALAELVPHAREALLAALGLIALGFAGSLLARLRRRVPERPGTVDESLGGLAIAKPYLETPEALLRMIEGLERLRAMHAELSEDESALADADAREAAWREQLRGLCEALSLEPDGEIEVVAGRLNRALEEAADQLDRAQRDEVERREARSGEGALLPQLESKRAHLARVRAVLERGVPGASDLAQAYARAERLEEERRRLRDTEARLANAKRADELRERVRRWERAPGGDEPPWSEARALAAERELASIKRRVSELDRRQGEIAVRLQSDPGSRTARAREEQALLEDQLEGVLRERDRLALLASLLRQAEEAHRKEHQPDVLRRAGTYLSEITGGRYARPEYPSPDSRQLHVTPRDRGEPVPVGPPISQGTQDQIYLCLRLGLLDHLDRARESLPLVLDETLVNWDAPRRRAVYPLLRRVAARRQVFLLTCHEHFAEEVERALGLRRISLERTATDS